MNIEEALRWVEVNCADAATLKRIRSRQVAMALAEEIESLRECLARARQICSNAHDMVLRGADDDELLAILEEGYGLTPMRNIIRPEVKNG